MKIILDTDNIFEYLARLNYCNLADRATSQMTIIDAKNFNILVALADGRNLLVKQELHNDRGQTKGEFWAAWQIQQLMESFPDFGNKICGFLPEILYFDPDNSILIVKFLAEYGDLYRYYTTEHQFPIEVARAIGQLLATIHSKTFQRPAYQQFFSSGESNRQSHQQYLID
jgi:5-methylthioribose kinase